MGFLAGKRAFIVGVATDRSIAWGIAQAMHREGAELAFSYVNDKMKERVEPLAHSLGSRLTMPLDVTLDEQCDAAFERLAREWGELDILVHAVAYAPREALTGGFLESRRRFLPRLCLGELHGEERIQPGTCLQREPLHDRGAEPFVKTVDRRMHKAAHAVGRRWFDALVFTAGVDRGHEGIFLPLLR